MTNCSECGEHVPDRYVETKEQTHHLSGRPNATETIVTGYDCQNCGHYYTR